MVLCNFLKRLSTVIFQHLNSIWVPLICGKYPFSWVHNEYLIVHTFFTIALLQEIENNPTQVLRAQKGWNVSILKSIFNVTVSIFRLKLIYRKNNFVGDFSCFIWNNVHAWQYCEEHRIDHYLCTKNQQLDCWFSLL